jgi:hypothetical protein
VGAPSLCGRVARPHPGMGVGAALLGGDGLAKSVTRNGLEWGSGPARRTGNGVCVCVLWARVRACVCVVCRVGPSRRRGPSSCAARCEDNRAAVPPAVGGRPSCGRRFLGLQPLQTNVFNCGGGCPRLGMRSRMGCCCSPGEHDSAGRGLAWAAAGRCGLQRRGHGHTPPWCRASKRRRRRALQALGARQGGRGAGASTRRWAPPDVLRSAEGSVRPRWHGMRGGANGTQGGGHAYERAQAAAPPPVQLARAPLLGRHQRPAAPRPEPRLCSAARPTQCAYIYAHIYMYIAHR